MHGVATQSGFLTENNIWVWSKSEVMPGWHWQAAGCQLLFSSYLMVVIHSS
jgi:hypothetical protein